MSGVTDQLQAIANRWGKEYEVYIHNQHYFVRGPAHYFVGSPPTRREYTVILLVYSLREVITLTNEQFEQDLVGKIITEAFGND